MYADKDYILSLRHELHEYPEIGFDLPKTLSVVKRELERLDIGYTEQYGVKGPCGYEVNISSQGDNFIQVDFDTPWCQPESDVVAELSRRFGCTLEHWYAEQGCNFCGWQRYERGELVDVLWGELEWSSPTDDDELPEVTGPAWIVDNVAHYGG